MIYWPSVDPYVLTWQVHKSRIKSSCLGSDHNVSAWLNGIRVGYKFFHPTDRMHGYETVLTLSEWVYETKFNCDDLQHKTTF